MIIRLPSKLLDLSPLSLFDVRFIRAADTKFKFQFLRAFAENQNLHRLRMIWEGIHKRDSPAFDWWLECEQQRNSQNYPLSVSFPYFQTILSIHNWKIARLLFTELDQSKLTSKIFSRRTKSLFSKIFRKILILMVSPPSSCQRVEMCGWSNWSIMQSRITARTTTAIPTIRPYFGPISLYLYLYLLLYLYLY